MTRPVSPCLIVLLSLASPPLAAQTATPARECGQTSTIPFARQVMGRLCGLADRPEVRKATGATDTLSLFATFPKDVLWRVPDTSLVSFAQTFAANLALLPDSICATMYPHPGVAPWAERFMSVAEAADSAIAVRWADFLEAWVWATVNHAPRRPTASPAEATAQIRAGASSLSPDDRRLLTELALGHTLSPKDACHAVRVSFAWIGRGSPQQTAAAFRALMNGLAPWTVAT